MLEMFFSIFVSILDKQERGGEMRVDQADRGAVEESIMNGMMQVSNLNFSWQADEKNPECDDSTPCRQGILP